MQRCTPFYILQFQWIDPTVMQIPTSSWKATCWPLASNLLHFVVGWWGCPLHCASSSNVWEGSSQRTTFLAEVPIYIKLVRFQGSSDISEDNSKNVKPPLESVERRIPGMVVLQWSPLISGTHAKQMTFCCIVNTDGHPLGTGQYSEIF